MSFPTAAPVLTQQESVNAIAEAEAGILQCIQDFLCTTLTSITADVTLSLKEQVDLAKTLICASAAKEDAVGEVLQGLAAKISADNGCCPDGGNQTC